MRSIFTAAAAALLSLALAGCETTGNFERNDRLDSKGKTSETTLEYGYAGRPHGKLISSYAKANGIPESLAHAVITVESNYRASARGAAGEIGLMQIKPSTARMMGYRGSTKGLYHPETNIEYGMKYLAMAHKLVAVHLRHHPQIQCRPWRETDEPGFQALLRQGCQADEVRLEKPFLDQTGTRIKFAAR
jgi:hypothetical protein